MLHSCCPGLQQALQNNIRRYNFQDSQRKRLGFSLAVGAPDLRTHSSQLDQSKMGLSSCGLQRHRGADVSPGLPRCCADSESISQTISNCLNGLTDGWGKWALDEGKETAEATLTSSSACSTILLPHRWPNPSLQASLPTLQTIQENLKSPSCGDWCYIQARFLCAGPSPDLHWRWWSAQAQVVPAPAPSANRKNKHISTWYLSAGKPKTLCKQELSVDHPSVVSHFY